MNSPPDCLRSIYYYVVSWDSSKCSWESFRGDVLGPTDPATAPASSLRGKIMAQWKVRIALAPYCRQR